MSRDTQHVQVRVSYHERYSCDSDSSEACRGLAVAVGEITDRILRGAAVDLVRTARGARGAAA